MFSFLKSGVGGSKVELDVVRGHMSSISLYLLLTPSIFFYLLLSPKSQEPALICHAEADAWLIVIGLNVQWAVRLQTAVVWFLEETI